MKHILILACLALSACATPVTTLHAKDGAVITCGGSKLGSVLGGLAGYKINEQIDKKCVADAQAQGAK